MLEYGRFVEADLRAERAANLSQLQATNLSHSFCQIEKVSLYSASLIIPVGQSGFRSGMPIQTVLIVEDNEGFAETLAEVLKSRGFQTHWVATPEDAHVASRARLYDLMIIDHGLEGQSGIDVARALAQEKLIQRVVFLTGRVSMNESEIPANLKGRAAVLHKPVEMDDLISTIQQLTPGL